jgi:hypothetical protein
MSAEAKGGPIFPMGGGWARRSAMARPDPEGRMVPQERSGGPVSMARSRAVESIVSALRKSAGPEPPEPGKRGAMRGPRAGGFPPKSAPHR